MISVHCTSCFQFTVLAISGCVVAQGSHSVLVGSRLLMTENSVPVLEEVDPIAREFEDRAETIVFIAVDGMQTSHCACPGVCVILWVYSQTVSWLHV